jgi:hypothetical protein
MKDKEKTQAPEYVAPLARLPVDKRNRISRGALGVINQANEENFLEVFDGKKTKKRAHRKYGKRSDRGRKEYVEETNYDFT